MWISKILESESWCGLKIYINMGRELRRYKIKEIRKNYEEIKKMRVRIKMRKMENVKIKKTEKTVRCGWAAPPYQPLTSFSLSLFFCQGS